MKLAVLDLTPEVFAPFGSVIEGPERPHDAAGPGWRWWGEIALLAGDGRPYGVGYLDLEPADLVFNWAERHMQSMELLVPVGGDCLVYVGPPDNPEVPGQMPPLERFRVFRVRQGQAVLLREGVWHGAPMALDRPLKVIVLLHQGTGERDGYLVRFEDTPVSVERP